MLTHGRRCASCDAARRGRRRWRCWPATRSPTSSSARGCAPCGLDPWRLGGELWGYVGRRRARGALLLGRQPRARSRPAHDALRAFAERARRQGRRCSSIVGPRRDRSRRCGSCSSRRGGRPARSAPASRCMAIDRRRRRSTADPLVRRVRPDELDVLLPACIAMFTEEVGVSPLVSDGGAALPRPGRRAGRGGPGLRPDRGRRVVFKAEIGAVTPRACQVQGVWVAPDLRGRRSGRARDGRGRRRSPSASIAPVVSLYVNDYNEPALAHLPPGRLRRVGRFATVLF